MSEETIKSSCGAAKGGIKKVYFVPLPDEPKETEGLSASEASFVEWLNEQISDHERTAEEYIQELDNQEGCDIEMAKAEALKGAKSYFLKNRSE